ncbi:hypothetical protein AGMMS50284_4870 [Clostridia bacterium]|nr:hypothetical protein AGMMS50284_4870 [Clostridia bacterium]
MKKKSRLKVIGILLIVIGIFIFAIGCTDLAKVQSGRSQYSEGFMIESYETGKAQRSIPCYMMMGFGGAMCITGLILIVVKRNNKLAVANTQAPYFCPNCKNTVIYGNSFCSNCGTKLFWNQQN